MKGRCIYEGEDVFMKAKMCLWGEDVFMKGKMYLWRRRGIYEREDVFMKGRCIYEGEDVFMKERSIYEGRKKSWNFWGNRKEDAFQKPKKSLEFLISKVDKFGDFLKEKSERNVWESVLAKIPGIFEPFATARFYNSKGNRRCAGCRFVRDAVGAQISIKKSQNFMRNGWGKPPMEIPHTIFAIRRFRFYGII